jgi:SAM-dependent methyltransferase
MTPPPKPLRDISATGRSLQSLWNHFLVERELAAQLLQSPRSRRSELFAALYAELFRRVTDHPRLVRRESAEAAQRAVAARLALLDGLLRPDCVMVEVAPGDCTAACAAALQAGRVIGLDISDQRSAGLVCPDNFELRVFDGYEVDLPDGEADVAFSHQFLEHLHPEDVEGHMALVARLLREGGCYVLDTPHAFSGPHDVSRYFSEVPCGFHFHEWTYRELWELGQRHGFGAMSIYRCGRRWDSALALGLTLALERCVGWLPTALRWRLSQRLFGSVTVCLWRTA